MEKVQEPVALSAATDNLGAVSDDATSQVAWDERTRRKARMVPRVIIDWKTGKYRCK